MVIAMRNGMVYIVQYGMVFNVNKIRVMIHVILGTLLATVWFVGVVGIIILLSDETRR
jgi:hypothetical protein